MAWFKWGKSDEEELRDLEKRINALDYDMLKSNPAQEEIANDQLSSTQYTSRHTRSHVSAYKNLEVVNRGVNMTVDAVADFKVDIKERIPGLTPVSTHMRREKLEVLLNHKANPYMSSHELMRQVSLDLILEGNAFLYWDKVGLYILPAINVEIIPDPKKFIKEYRYNNEKFLPEEIIHIRDNASDSVFRGASRLLSAVSSITILNTMNTYQNNFFKNNTILGVVLKTPDMLSPKIKQRKILEWMRDYNATSGGRRPVILDGGYELEDLAKYSFKELDFAESIRTQEVKIAKALGIPPVLLESGNNANIAPNLKLFYTNTVMPLLEKIITAFEIYFGFDLSPVTANILALRPELRDQANYYSTLVNAGIMTRNEAREKLRLEKSDDEVADRLVLPANIAGSASDSTVGGRPADNDNED